MNWIDKTAPEMDVSFSTTESTNADVVATMAFAEPVTITSEGVSVLNSDGTPYDGMPSTGPKTITFTENDSIAIEFVDEVDNVGHKTIAVDWIDREEPTGTVTYSTTDITDQPVVATVEPDKEGVTVTSEGGATHTFDANGEFTFEFEDALGNKGSATAKVDWIDRIPPTASLVYNKDETTGKMIVRVVDPSEEITFAEGNGTYEYAANGDYEIVFYDKAGNEGRLIAHVDSLTGPVVPDGPALKIISLGFNHAEAQDIEWAEGDDGHLHGRIELPRSKMPAKPEDFDLEVPEGVDYSIARRDPSMHPIIALLAAREADDSDQPGDSDQPDIWDIALADRANPARSKTYTLEVAPLDDDPTDPTDPVGPDAPTGPSDPTQPSDGPDDPQQSGGSGGGSSNGLANAGLGSNARTDGTSGLTATGDGHAALLLSLGGVSLLALVVGLVLFRRARSEA